MKFKGIFRSIILVAMGFLCITVGLFYFIYHNRSTEQSTCAIPTPVFVCGTANLSEEAQKGEQVFNANYAACHHLDKKMTGSTLRFVDSITYWKYMTLRKIKVPSATLEKLGKEYHQSYLSINLSKEDLKNIIAICSKKSIIHSLILNS